jgi:hypothetical protein
MLTRKRIYIQLGFVFIICLLFFPIFLRVKSIQLFVLGFAGVLLAGCLLALAKLLWANWLLIIGSVGILCIGIYFNLLRFQFILINPGLVHFWSYGSLFRWIIATIVFMVPGAIFTFWNVKALTSCAFRENEIH